MPKAMLTELRDHWEALHIRLHRWRWGVRCLIAIVVIPWLCHFVYTRTTIMPPLPDEYTAYNQLVSYVEAPANNRIQDLVAAFDQIPPVLTIPLPPTPPPDKKWVWDGDWWMTSTGTSSRPCPLRNMQLAPCQFLEGAWSPETSYLQGLLIKYIASSEFRDGMAHIIAMTGGFLSPTNQREVNSLSSEGGSADSIPCWLLAQARSRAMQEGDIAGSAQAIRAVLRIVSALEANGCLWRVTSAEKTRAKALWQIIYLSREVDLTASQADLLGRVIEEQRLDLQAVWHRAIAGERLFVNKLMDAAYTRDTNGDGWYVLHRYNANESFDRLRCLANLVSFFMVDRRAMAQRVSAQLNCIEGYADGPYSILLERLRSYGPVSAVPSIVEGDFPQSVAPNWLHIYADCIRNQVREVAARTALMLSVYKHDHGGYPDCLEDLVPHYLPAVPSDVRNGRPLYYRRDERDGYVLYTDELRADRGNAFGLIRDEKGEFLGYQGDTWDDDILSAPRRRVWGEVYLVNVDAAESQYGNTRY